MMGILYTECEYNLDKINNKQHNLTLGSRVAVLWPAKRVLVNVL